MFTDNAVFFMTTVSPLLPTATYIWRLIIVLTTDSYVQSTTDYRPYNRHLRTYDDWFMFSVNEVFHDYSIVLTTDSYIHMTTDYRPYYRQLRTYDDLFMFHWECRCCFFMTAVSSVLPTAVHRRLYRWQCQSCVDDWVVFTVDKVYTAEVGDKVATFHGQVNGFYWRVRRCFKTGWSLVTTVKSKLY